MCVEIPLLVHGSFSQNNDTTLEIFFRGNSMRGLIPLAIKHSSVLAAIELEPASVSPNNYFIGLFGFLCEGDFMGGIVSASTTHGKKISQ